MPRSRFVLHSALALEEIEIYHTDILAALSLYFSSDSPSYTVRFAGNSPTEVQSALAQRIDESELRSTLALLTSLEASFRIDFDSRCRGRLKDDLSRYFQGLEKERGDKIRLDEDILEGWKLHSTAPPSLIAQLKGAFKFRHWLAHGRYWIPKLGRAYDFELGFTMTSAIVSGFPFVS
jgi:hypothetical protein